MKRILSRVLFALLTILAAASLLMAQPRGPASPYQVTITPDHADWKYALGEKATFTIKVSKLTAPATGQTAPAASQYEPAVGQDLKWSLGPDMMPPTQTQTVKLTGQEIKVDAGTLKEPGFLRITATVQDGAATGAGARFARPNIGTVGFAPEQIKPVTKNPDDFDKFWQESKDLLAKIPMGAQIKPYPAKSTATLDAFEVSFQTISGDALGRSRMYGILTKPKAPGKYPALLRVPGAGVYGVPGIVKEAWENTITLSLGVNGVPLTLEGSIYNDLMSGALSAYNRFNLDRKDRYYYRRVYLGCIRAVDYIFSLPEFDGVNVGVIGSSQGGALSIVTAALDPRIRALVSIHPALSDITGYMFGRAGGWPDIFADPVNRTKENLDTEQYYDTVNFARRVKVPGIYSWGYNDTTCDPTSTYAAYNVITAPKTLHLELETGHFTVKPQEEKVAAWMQEMLKTGKPPAAK
jgi:cephalosporin-C deacetylase